MYITKVQETILILYHWPHDWKERFGKTVIKSVKAGQRQISTNPKNICIISICHLSLITAQISNFSPMIYQKLAKKQFKKKKKSQHYAAKCLVMKFAYSLSP